MVIGDHGYLSFFLMIEVRMVRFAFLVDNCICSTTRRASFPPSVKYSLTSSRRGEVWCGVVKMEMEMEINMRGARYINPARSSTS